MPKAVSRKQYKLMQAIAHGAKISGGRGAPPKEIADKYISATKDTKNLPETHGENRGGNWDHAAHARHHKKESKKAGGKKTKEGKHHRNEASHHLKEHKKKLHKAYEEFYKGRAAAAIVLDHNGRVLLGLHMGGKQLTTPGGHVEVNENEAFAALRELQEETGITGRNPHKIYSHKSNGNSVDTFLIEAYTGTPKSTKEIKSPKWYEPQDIPWDKLRECCVEPLKYFIENKFGKSLKGMLALDNLQKNIIRQRGDAVFEVSHGEALNLVGNGLFRKINSEVKSMTDESFKDIQIDTYTVHIRKHMNDVYSGRVVDGHKQVYQFTNKSLPELTAGLMSVFEWYMPEDEKIFDMVDDMPDDAIHGGINNLMENYRRHNIANIYDEMEEIRREMRQGMAVDLQQIEARMMKLFDKIEELVHELAGKHNKLAEGAGNDIDMLEQRLRELAVKLDEMEKKPETVEAYSSNPKNPDIVHRDEYPYLPKPTVEIEPSGRIRISFGSDWSALEKENFLKDVRAKVIHKAIKSNG